MPPLPAVNQGTATTWRALLDRLLVAVQAFSLTDAVSSMAELTFNVKQKVAITAAATGVSRWQLVAGGE